eukprot:1159730-Pelagomonas_calceolata.AAC.4
MVERGRLTHSVGGGWSSGGVRMRRSGAHTGRFGCRGCGGSVRPHRMTWFGGVAEVGVPVGDLVFPRHGMVGRGAVGAVALGHTFV